MTVHVDSVYIAGDKSKVLMSNGDILTGIVSLDVKTGDPDEYSEVTIRVYINRDAIEVGE